MRGTKTEKTETSKDQLTLISVWAFSVVYSSKFAENGFVGLLLPRNLRLARPDRAPKVQFRSTEVSGPVTEMTQNKHGKMKARQFHVFVEPGKRKRCSHPSVLFHRLLLPVRVFRFGTNLTIFLNKYNKKTKWPAIIMQNLFELGV